MDRSTVSISLQIPEDRGELMLDAEGKILEKLINGDKKSWENFAKTSTPFIKAVVYKTVSAYTKAEKPDIDDAVQNVFVKLLADERRLLRQYDPSKASFSTWIGLISRSVTIDMLRRRKSHMPLNEDLASSRQETEHHNDPVDLPAGLLSARQELILRLFFDREMEAEDIAKLLSIEAQTVRSTKHKAIEKLRKYYETRRREIS